MAVLLAKQLAQGPGEAGVRQGSGDGGRERATTASTMALRVDLEAPMAVKSQSILGRQKRANAHVRQERQYRAALMRVSGAVPRGAMPSEKARLIARTVVGKVRMRFAMIGS